MIEERPNEKFIIHCGYAHALEGNYESWGKAMAGRLTEFTGIDPLTIYQVLYTEKSKPEFNHPLLKALKLTEATALLDKEGNPMEYVRGESWSDIAILHPNTVFENGRPNWLIKNGNKMIKLNLKNIEMDYPIMVLAYKKGEDIKTAIPMDILEIENKTEFINLALRQGEYEIVVRNSNGRAQKFQLNAE